MTGPNTADCRPIRKMQASSSGICCTKKAQAASAMMPTSARLSQTIMLRRSSLSASWPLVAENSRKGRMNSAPITRPARLAGNQPICNW
ncbi:hypothetical protein FQZ97_909050 [compost metagenome]